MIITPSASGTPVPAIARLVAAPEDTVRDVIHRFNEIGLRALDPAQSRQRAHIRSERQQRWAAYGYKQPDPRHGKRSWSAH